MAGKKVYNIPLASSLDLSATPSVTEGAENKFFCDRCASRVPPTYGFATASYEVRMVESMLLLHSTKSVLHATRTALITAQSVFGE